MIRLPRIGKIKVGKKDEHDNPKGLDYFIIDSDYADKVFEVYHRKELGTNSEPTGRKLPPNIIRIAFPYNDIELNLEEMYRWYGTSGLKCTGDGETFNRFVEGKEPDGCPCHLAEPPEGQKQQCHISMRMSFMVLGIGVTGVWQFASKSVYSMSSVRSAMLMVKENTGQLAGIPFYMRVEMQKSAIAGNPHVFPVVSVDCAMNIEELMAHNIKRITSPARQLEEKKLDPKKEIKPEPEEKKKEFAPAIQREWDVFYKWLEDNRDKLKEGTYDTAMIWLKGLEFPTVEKLLKNLTVIKSQLISATASGEYKSYHDTLITNCCEALKTENRLPIIQTLNNMIKAWGIDGIEKLSDASENQCLNLVDEFDKMQKNDNEADLPY